MPNGAECDMTRAFVHCDLVLRNVVVVLQRKAAKAIISPVCHEQERIFLVRRFHSKPTLQGHVVENDAAPLKPFGNTSVMGTCSPTDCG